MQHIWNGKTNIMKILFILSRYSSMIYVYGQVLLLFVKPVTNTECAAFYYIDEIFNFMTGIAFLGIFTLRTYAIYGRSRPVFFILAIFASISFASLVWEVVAETAFAYPNQLQISPLNCNFGSSSSLFAAELVSIISAAVYDALVVMFTVYRTGRLALRSREAKISKSLSFILLRDGMLYYVVIFVPQFVVIVLSAILLKGGSVTLGSATNSLAYIKASLQLVLINRLVLNLSHAASAQEDSEFRTRTGLEPMSFASGPVLGNIGGPVRSFLDEIDDEVLDLESHEMVDMERTVGEMAGPSNANERGGGLDSSEHPVAGEANA